MSDMPRSPLVASGQTNPEFQADGGMDDLFSGLSISDVGNSAAAPTTASTLSKPTVSSQNDGEKGPAAGRPELDLDLFSDLVTVEPISLESVNTASTAPTPTAVPESAKPVAISPEPSPSTTTNPPQPYVAPTVQKPGLGKKKKKINQIGYGRASESIRSTGSEVTVKSVGSWVDVGLKSKASESEVNSKGGEVPVREDAVGASSAGGDLDIGSTTENSASAELDSINIKPGGASPPAATVLLDQQVDGVEHKEVQEKLEVASSSENLAVGNGGDPFKNKSQLDDLRRRSASNSTSTEQALEKLNKKMTVLNGEQLRSLKQLAKDKDKISELESQQSAAVENEDFEKAANLAIEIDSLQEEVERCLVEIAKVEKDLKSCGSDQMEIRRVQMDFLVDAVAEVRGLRETRQTSSDETREKMEAELKELESLLSEKRSTIQEREDWLPHELADIERCRTIMEESAATRKQEKETKLTALHEEEETLKMEIDQLKAQLAAKETALENVMVEVQNLANSHDVELEQEAAALADRETGLDAEEAQVTELEKEAEQSEAECKAKRERLAKQMEEYDAQIEELSGVGDKYEQQLESLKKVSKKEKDLFDLLSRLMESKGEAEKSRQQLEAENESQKESLKDLGSEIVTMGITIRSLQEEIGKAEVRLPELDELKKAAVASKDFKQAASLSAQAKDIAAQKESAELKLTETTSHLSDIEQQHKDMTDQVSSLETRVEAARRASGLAQYVQLKSILKGEKLGLIPATSNDGEAVMELVCKSLEADFQFDEGSIDDSLKEIENLADSC
ncbi:hypothetical protein BSKO_11722 [Bryopsis sp. KO-2023]|nr:hypothetical protein BSKO_11722 [Bryopsis sp. KO-2023]